MIIATARAELRKARETGHCGWCQARAEEGKTLYSTAHNRGCKAVNDANIRRRR